MFWPVLFWSDDKYPHFPKESLLGEMQQHAGRMEDL